MSIRGRVRTCLLAAVVAVATSGVASAQRRAGADQGPALRSEYQAGAGAVAPRAPAAPGAPMPGPGFDVSGFGSYVYTNDLGVFVTKRRRGAAEYTWYDGSLQRDRLLAVHPSALIFDPEAPGGRSVCELYRVPGQPFWLAFSKAGASAPGRTRPFFRTYYSWDGGTFYRMKTASGTSRVPLPDVE